jgi:hypothetical protein
VRVHTVQRGSDTPIPEPLPLLERVLEVLFSKLTKRSLRSPLDVLQPVKSATPKLQLHLREQDKVARRPNLESKAVAEM